METLAQIIFLLVAVAIVRSYMRGGWPEVRHWWRSKLVGF